LSIVYRRPLVEDAEALARLHVRCWQETYAGIMDAAYLASLSVEDRVGRWRKNAEEPAGRYLIAVDGDVLVGFAGAAGAEKGLEAFGDGQVHMIYVAASHFRRGIGTVLFSDGLQYLKDFGKRRAFVCVVTGNDRAVAFYKAMGGELAGQVPLEFAGMKLTEEIFQYDLAAFGKKWQR
jgi:ribosomal protein S18 acetylase RimI-like enzyme